MSSDKERYAKGGVEKVQCKCNANDSRFVYRTLKTVRVSSSSHVTSVRIVGGCLEVGPSMLKHRYRGFPQ